MNETILSIVPGDKVKSLMDALRHLDSKTEMQGLRAYVWQVEDAI